MTLDELHASQTFEFSLWELATAKTGPPPDAWPYDGPDFDSIVAQSRALEALEVL